MFTLTYQTLKSRIQDILENDGTEFVEAIPNFINRAQQRLTRETDVIGLNVFAQTTFNIGDPFIDRPVDALIVKNLNYKTNEGTRIQLLQMTNEYLNDYASNRSEQGSPRYYANYGSDKLLVAPSPSSASTVEMEYVAQPPVLSSTTNETNYFTDYCGNALLYASLVEACYYMKNPSAGQVWEAQYMREINGLNNEARRSRRDDMIVAANPSGGEDNLMNGQP
jgi:hypothetical protein